VTAGADLAELALRPHLAGQADAYRAFQRPTKELPQHYADDSFFGVQGQKTAVQ
jgi:hypothetical protein